MLNFDVKRKINTLRDILVGKVPDPKAQVEQITIALIYKFMDDMDLQATEFGGAREFFKGDYEKHAFSQIMLAEHSAQDRLILYAEGIEKLTNNPDLPKGRSAAFLRFTGSLCRSDCHLQGYAGIYRHRGRGHHHRRR